MCPSSAGAFWSSFLRLRTQSMKFAKVPSSRFGVPGYFGHTTIARCIRPCNGWKQKGWIEAKWGTSTNNRRRGFTCSALRTGSAPSQLSCQSPQRELRATGVRKRGNLVSSFFADLRPGQHICRALPRAKGLICLLRTSTIGAIHHLGRVQVEFEVTATKTLITAPRSLAPPHPPPEHKGHPSRSATASTRPR